MLDSTLYDAYLGIGAYQYHRSKYFSWLPLLKDQRPEGIENIRKAIARSKFSRYTAMNSLSWILIAEKRFAEGLEIAEKALTEFPENRFFLLAAAKANRGLRNWKIAADYYLQVLDGLNRHGTDSLPVEISCRKNLSKLYIKMKHFSKAQAECEQLIRIHRETTGLSKHDMGSLEKTAKKCKIYFAERRSRLHGSGGME